MTEKMIIQNATTVHMQTVAHNTSRDDCITVIFSELEYLPWDNPDNIVSAEVEAIVRGVKNNLLVILFLIGGPANVINMAVFYKQGLKDRVNLCLFALSLADELYLLVSMFVYGEEVYFQFTTRQRFGPGVMFFVNNNLMALVGFCFVSPVLSTIIAVERCLCVFNPLKFQNLMQTRTMGAIIIVVHVVVFSFFFVMCFRYRIGCVYDPELGVVEMTGVEVGFYRAHKEFIDNLDSFVFGIGLPGTEMIVVTIATIMTIVKLRQAMTWRSKTSSTISVHDAAVTRMLVGNSILFVICISPSAPIRFSRLFYPEINAGRRNQNFFICGLWFVEIFTYINATFNICVYYAMGSRYRETFWELFRRKIQSDKKSESGKTL